MTHIKLSRLAKNLFSNGPDHWKSEQTPTIWIPNVFSIQAPTIFGCPVFGWFTGQLAKSKFSGDLNSKFISWQWSKMQSLKSSVLGCFWYSDVRESYYLRFWWPSNDIRLDRSNAGSSLQHNFLCSFYLVLIFWNILQTAFSFSNLLCYMS